MRHKLWLVIVILLLAAAGLFAFAATGHTYFAALLALIAALAVLTVVLVTETRQNVPAERKSKKST